MKKKPKYQKDLPRKIYSYFATYSGQGVPSVSKFAREIGVTVEDIRRFREAHREFERAVVECSEIRRDYLIDNALARKYDASLTKFLLACEFGMGEDTPDEDARRLEVTVEVMD